MHVTLPGLDRERPVHDRAHRELVNEAAVYADDGYNAAASASQNGLAERDWAIRLEPYGLGQAVVGEHRPVPVGFHPDRVDAGVRPAPGRHFLERVLYVDLFVIDGF